MRTERGWRAGVKGVAAFRLTTESSKASRILYWLGCRSSSDLTFLTRKDLGIVVFHQIWSSMSKSELFPFFFKLHIFIFVPLVFLFLISDESLFVEKILSLLLKRNVSICLLKSWLSLARVWGISCSHASIDRLIYPVVCQSGGTRLHESLQRVDNIWYE